MGSRVKVSFFNQLFLLLTMADNSPPGNSLSRCLLRALQNASVPPGPPSDPPLPFLPHLKARTFSNTYSSIAEIETRLDAVDQRLARFENFEQRFSQFSRLQRKILSLVSNIHHSHTRPRITDYNLPAFLLTLSFFFHLRPKP